MTKASSPQPQLAFCLHADPRVSTKAKKIKTLNALKNIFLQSSVSGLMSVVSLAYNFPDPWSQRECCRSDLPVLLFFLWLANACSLSPPLGFPFTYPVSGCSIRPTFFSRLRPTWQPCGSGHSLPSLRRGDGDALHASQRKRGKAESLTSPWLSVVCLVFCLVLFFYSSVLSASAAGRNELSSGHESRDSHRRPEGETDFPSAWFLKRRKRMGFCSIGNKKENNTTKTVTKKKMPRLFSWQE